MAKLISLAPSVFAGTFEDLLADFPAIASAAEPTDFEFDGEVIEADGFGLTDQCVLRYRGVDNWTLTKRG